MLTSAGEAFVEPARQVMRDLETARSVVRTIAGLAGGTLDIVAPTTPAVDPLADLAGAFRRRHPAIDIVIVEPPNAAAVADVVRTGECELGLADVRTHGKAVETLEPGAVQAGGSGGGATLRPLSSGRTGGAR
ncbi:hypothetical protein [Streptomyces coeruleorubidus]|jgi:DNA-binding transcriptional LysR family regulator|uniref:hypothetical protein n=1 Tax=Streptomyces coeruleorubidus TaxID=116188 RepID=UPI00339FE235